MTPSFLSHGVISLSLGKCLSWPTDGSPIVVQAQKGGCNAGWYGGPYASRICALGTNRPLEGA
jgi:hypothetical protein